MEPARCILNALRPGRCHTILSTIRVPVHDHCMQKTQNARIMHTLRAVFSAHVLLCRGKSVVHSAGTINIGSRRVLLVFLACVCVCAEYSIFVGLQPRLACCPKT